MNISELKMLWQESGFRPDKLLGQNFLIDNNIRYNIIDSLHLTKKDIVVEIGPGFGIMTFDLAEKCAKVFAVEKDRRVCSLMGGRFEEKGNIELIEGDFLETDISTFAKDTEKVVMYGNVPYYITTPIVEKVIESRQYVKSLYMVIQDEYADRLAAKPSTKAYGSLSCFVQYYAEVKKVMKISKGCFFPSPNVDSCFVRLEMLENPKVDVKDPPQMFRIIRKAFSQRRKKMLNVISCDDFLSRDKDAWRGVFEKCDISTDARAEELSLAQFATISDAVS